jgi:uncharacterized repeat protein (TIGR01451 family)
MVIMPAGTFNSRSTILTWGSNSAGQLGDGTTTNRSSPVRAGSLTDIRAIAAGSEHSLTALADGRVFAWGDNNYGQLGNNASPTDSSSPVLVSGLSNVTSVASGVGGEHSLALTGAGGVYAWGYNGFGELAQTTSSCPDGHGGFVGLCSRVPLQVSSLPSDTLLLAGGDFFSLALRNAPNAPKAASADVEVTMTQSTATVVAGSPITYTVTVTNHGGDPADNVSLVDTLPSGVTFLAASPQQGQCSQASGSVTCALNTIANGASTSVSIQVSPPTATTLTNAAEAHATQTDPTPTNNRKSIVASAGANANIRLDASSRPPSPNIGDFVSFTVIATNQGPGTAANVHIVNTIPPGSNPEVQGAVGGTCAQPTATTFDCSFGSVNANQSVGFVYKIKTTQSGTITNNATATSDTPDPDPSDNTLATSVTIGTNPLTITSAQALPTATVGQPYSATLAATGGTKPYTWSLLDGTLPPGLTLSQDGVLSGTLAAAYQGSFTVKVRDLYANSTTQVFSLTAGSACGPRPQVSVSVAKNGDGRLRVTIASNNNAILTNNALQSITWDRMDNALVQGVQTPAAPGGQLPLAAGTHSTTFYVARISAAQAATVRLTVKDACGDWKTFVGGGPSAF